MSRSAEKASPCRFWNDFVDGGLAPLIILALEHRGQSRFEIVDQFVHRVVKIARAARRKFDGDRLVRIGEIIDIDPVGRAGLCRRLSGQHGLDGVLHAGAVGTDHKQVEAGLADLHSKPDRFDSAGLADKPVDRLQLCRC